MITNSFHEAFALVAVRVVVGFALVAAAVAPGVYCQSGKGEPQRLGYIDRLVAEAKADGRTRVTIPPVMVERNVPLKLTDVLAKSSVVVGTVTSVSVTKKPYMLESWYRLRIEEVLLRQHVVSARDTVPTGVRPPGPGELLLPENGGETIVDGVTVHQNGYGFTVGERYVLVVYLDLGGAVGLVLGSEDGAFRVAADGAVRVSGHAPLVGDLQSRGLTTLDSLRAFFRTAAR